MFPPAYPRCKQMWTSSLSLSLSLSFSLLLSLTLCQISLCKGKGLLIPSRVWWNEIRGNTHTHTHIYIELAKKAEQITLDGKGYDLYLGEVVYPLLKSLCISLTFLHPSVPSIPLCETCLKERKGNEGRKKGALTFSKWAMKCIKRATKCAFLLSLIPLTHYSLSHSECTFNCYFRPRPKAMSVQSVFYSLSSEKWIVYFCLKAGENKSPVFFLLPNSLDCLGSWQVAWLNCAKTGKWKPTAKQPKR